MAKFSESPYTAERVVLSKSDERLLLREYASSTCDLRRNDIADRVLKSRAPWVQSILLNWSMPGYADLDTVFSDVMLAIYGSLSNYDEERSSPTTYFYLVVRNSMLDSVKSQAMPVEQLTTDKVLDGVEDLSECIDSVRRAVDGAPDEEMNERSRKVAHMLLRGYEVPMIAEVLQVTRKQAEQMVVAVRNYIAWLMVKEGLSAEPILLDEDLYDLAMQHEEANRQCWR